MQTGSSGSSNRLSVSRTGTLDIPHTCRKRFGIQRDKESATRCIKPREAYELPRVDPEHDNPIRIFLLKSFRFGAAFHVILWHDSRLIMHSMHAR